MPPRSSSRIIFFLAFDIFALVILFKVIEPIATWYLTTQPAVGVDLYNSATQAAYQLKHFSLPFNSFKDIWFGGYPLMRDFPQLSFYLMTPFAALYGAPLGVQIFAVASLFLLLLFSYFLFLELSKNLGLSLLLAILVALSPNIYGALTWAGSIPYFASQVFFPLGLLAGAKYLKNPNVRYLGLAILVTGVGILIHPLGIITFLVPSLIFIIALAGLTVVKPWIITFQHLFLYIAGFLLASFTFSYDFLSFLITLFAGGGASPIFTTSTSGKVGVSPTALAISEFYREQIKLLYTQTNLWFFIILVVGVALFVATILFARKKSALIILPFFLIVLYTAAHPTLNLAGILSIFRHDPYRAFWTFPIAVGVLTSAFWGYLFSLMGEKLEQLKRLPWISLNILLIFVNLGFIIFSYFVYTSQIQKVLDRVAATSELSSAYPEALSINLEKENLEGLKGQLTPSFIDPGDRNKRLYTADATVNIWWNSFFDMPLARGYTDPPIGVDRRAFLFLLDIAIANDTIVREFKVPQDQALNDALFLIDWNGIYFFEGGRLGSKGPSLPPSSYLLKNNVFAKEEEVTAYGAVLKWQTVSGKPELHMDVPQILKYYKVDERFSSPILSATNSPAIVVFSNWAGYEDILRVLASTNLNSRYIIPVYGGEFVDSLTIDGLASFDAVILSQYNYRSQRKAFDLLEKYVEEGGKVFIDTGGEVKEADSQKLPGILPITTSHREGMGKTWDLEVTSDEITKGIDISQFGPPIFNEDEWKISTPRSERDIKEGSTVLLRHKDRPVLIKRPAGKGEVVWSGFNLAYHYNQYKNIEEARLLTNILSQFTPLKENGILASEVKWVRPEKVLIKTEGKPRGLLFKEQGYLGWSAELISPAKRGLPIFRAGPTYPGFMYVPLSEVGEGSLTAEFTYSGEPKFWVATLINVIAILLLLELAIFNGRLVGERLFLRQRKIRNKLGSWWEKEEG